SIKYQDTDGMDNTSAKNVSPVIQEVVISNRSQGNVIEEASLKLFDTTPVYIHGTYRDENGCNDVGNMSVVFHRSGVETVVKNGKLACAVDDERSCYDSSSVGYTVDTNVYSSCDNE